MYIWSIVFHLVTSDVRDQSAQSRRDGLGEKNLKSPMKSLEFMQPAMGHGALWVSFK